jgi:hypothetical protein
MKKEWDIWKIHEKLNLKRNKKKKFLKIIQNIKNIHQNKYLLFYY